MTKFTDWIKAYEVEMKMFSGDNPITNDMTADLISWDKMVSIDGDLYLVVNDAADTADWIASWGKYEDVFPEELEEAKAEGKRQVNIREIPTPRK